MCIVVDICDTHTLLDIFFTFPPAGPQTKGLVKSLDFPTQLIGFAADELPVHYRGGVGKSEMMRGGLGT